jgi:hypothetical protein
MRTLEEVQRYFDAHGLELRARRVNPQRWEAKLLTAKWSATHNSEWAMEGDDLAGAVDSAIAAHSANMRKDVS